MSDNIYKTPESNVESSHPEYPLPSIWMVVLFLLGVSLAVGLLLQGIEAIMGPASSTNFLPTLLAGLTVGMHYGSKRGKTFSSYFRWKVVTLWVLTNIILFAALVILVFPEVLVDMTDTEGFTLIAVFLVVIVLVSCGLSYLLLLAGEKIGVKQWKKKQEKESN